MSASAHVVLGVTGSIAAHKAVDLASLLVKNGCAVHVVLTAHAQRFISAIPFGSAPPSEKRILRSLTVGTDQSRQRPE